MTARSADIHIPAVPGREEVTTTNTQPTKLLLTVPEAAERLGIGRTTMYELISTGQVKSVLVGRLRRVRPADLEAYTANLSTDQPTHAA